VLNRRRLIAALPVVLAATSACAAPARELTTYRSESCGCCKGWIAAMARAGYTSKDVVQDDVSPLWRSRNIPDELSSCHVAEIGGYVVIGHVPPADVTRLLAERPKAIGLTVPGMPIGSPGMEAPDGRREAYETLLLLQGGGTEVYARHA